PRTSKDSVMAQVKQDLIDAQDSLSENYVTAGRVRVNKFAAKAMLARVYLYNQEWAKAEETASELIDNTTYLLESDCDNVFSESSHEAIFQLLQVAPGTGTAEGIAYIPQDPTIIPDYYLSDTLLHAFETDDQRKMKWLNKNVVSVDGVDVDYYYPFKYKTGYAAPYPENIMVLRLAEQYLIRAEARAQLNNLTGANSGESDLNTIRARAGLLPTTAVTKEELLSAIEHENQIEFFCEWGHRWFDLRRTGRINEVMEGITPLKGGTWSSNWSVYPIPFYEIKLNPFLTQNAGYN
ncbi:MAG: RagB/SusD family nutrient uptake outer membrane protein, partial [Chitinophagaceae bacterium]|nr:RagB/SusD family nutrient uptake outer membrane protein [Chitinophagaceae bacterium]